MDILKEAQHEAGKQMAILVFILFLVLGLILLILAFVFNGNDTTEKYVSPLIYLMGIAELFAIFGAFATYLITGKNKKFVRKQLQNMKIYEEVIVLGFESNLAKYRELVAQRVTKFRGGLPSNVCRWNRRTKRNIPEAIQSTTLHTS